jgi:hypothetical protein
MYYKGTNNATFFLRNSLDSHTFQGSQQATTASTQRNITRRLWWMLACLHSRPTSTNVELGASQPFTSHHRTLQAAHGELQCWPWAMSCAWQPPALPAGWRDVTAWLTQQQGGVTATWSPYGYGCTLVNAFRSLKPPKTQNPKPQEDRC